jgi:hypothetical protein
MTEMLPASPMGRWWSKNSTEDFTRVFTWVFTTQADGSALPDLHREKAKSREVQDCRGFSG